MFAMAFILVVAVGALLLLLQLDITSRKARLSHIPGSLLARYTDLWQFYHSWRLVKNEGKDFSGPLTSGIWRCGPN